MNNVFIDTSGWATVFDQRQPLDQIAVLTFQQSLQNGDRLVTSNYVIAELVALLQSPMRVPRSRIF